MGVEHLDLLDLAERLEEEEEGLLDASTFSAFVTLQSSESLGKTNSSSFLAILSVTYKSSASGINLSLNESSNNDNFFVVFFL